MIKTQIKCPICNAGSTIRKPNVITRHFTNMKYVQAICHNCGARWLETARWLCGEELYLKPMSALDRLEMEQAKKQLFATNKSVIYRGFTVFNTAYAVRDKVEFSTPNIDTLLMIIFLITKE